MTERTGKADVKKVQFLLLGKGAAGKVGFWRFKRIVYRGSLLKVPDSPFSPGNLNFHIDTAGFGTRSYQYQWLLFPSVCGPCDYASKWPGAWWLWTLPPRCWSHSILWSCQQQQLCDSCTALTFRSPQTMSNSAVLNSPQMNKHRHHFLQIKPDWLKYT